MFEIYVIVILIRNATILFTNQLSILNVKRIKYGLHFTPIILYEFNAQILFCDERLVLSSGNVISLYNILLTHDCAIVTITSAAISDR